MKWEYKTLNADPYFGSALDGALDNFLELVNDQLKTLGEEGWELVSSHVLPFPDQFKDEESRKLTYSYVLSYTLKRPLE